MMKSKVLEYVFRFTIWLAILLIGISLLFMGIQEANAFGGKCYKRDGTLDIQCKMKEIRRDRDHGIQTYAKHSGTYYRRSRSGDNWRNHINREQTREVRRRYSTREYKSEILSQYKRYFGYRQKVTQREIALHHRTIRIRKQKAEHMAKFE